MPSKSDQDSGPQGTAKYFFEKQAALYDYFSKELIPRERLRVFAYEMSLPLWYFFGYFLARSSARLFTIQALAQSSPVPNFLGKSKCPFRNFLNLVNRLDSKEVT